jgi:membrane protease YdiL (CAAX protease family)
MSTFPEPLPQEPNDTPESIESPSTYPLVTENIAAPPSEWIAEPEESRLEPPPAVDIAPSLPADGFPSQPLFASQLPEPALREERIPHLGNLALLALLTTFGWLGAGMLLLLGLHFHLWGITSLAKAAADFRYNLASQAAQYLITFGGCLAVFPILWRKPFFVGVHWNFAFARYRFGRLIAAAVFCFFVAIVNGMLMPGPANAPIDELFRAPGAAWVLFAFGVTLAPFFEEMAFRGFLLPSLCTAYDWTVEHFTGAARRHLDEDGHPQWSRPAMLIASVITSVPFALMHGAQTSWSLGPFLLLIFVSLVLCWVRLSTRSLAASTMVHACYNFMLFSFMVLGTGGFKHLDKM